PKHRHHAPKVLLRRRLEPELTLDAIISQAPIGRRRHHALHAPGGKRRENRAAVANMNVEAQPFGSSGAGGPTGGGTSSDSSPSCSSSSGGRCSLSSSGVLPAMVPPSSRRGRGVRYRVRKFLCVSLNLRRAIEPVNDLAGVKIVGRVGARVYAGNIL